MGCKLPPNSNRLFPLKRPSVPKSFIHNFLSYQSCPLQTNQQTDPRTLPPWRSWNTNIWLLWIAAVYLPTRHNWASVASYTNCVHQIPTNDFDTSYAHRIGTRHRSPSNDDPADWTVIYRDEAREPFGLSWVMVCGWLRTAPSLSTSRGVVIQPLLAGSPATAQSWNVMPLTVGASFRWTQPLISRWSNSNSIAPGDVKFVIETPGSNILLPVSLRPLNPRSYTPHRIDC